MTSETVPVLTHIAAVDGLLYTKWGPCVCTVEGANNCIACRHAAELEAAGLDYETEFHKRNTR